tara:strand:+ start:25 stop:1038 length:1014 start_codon:yes stop_codon:yes gene_type:complete
MNPILGTFLANVGASLIAGKVASNRAKDPKGPIGSGTAPSIQPGEGGGFTPVAGSEVQDFGDFEYKDMTEPEMTDEEQLAMLLQQLGLSEEGGVVNAAYGKVLQKNQGGGIISLEQIKELFPDIDFMNERPSSEIIDFSNIEEPDLADTMVAQLEQDPSNLIQDFSMSFETDTPGVMSDTPELQEVPTGFQNTMLGIEQFAEANPETFNALTGGIIDIIMAATRDMPEPKGSLVSTRTLPAGNAARRRNQLENITPLGGSTVTFAKNGKVLNRPMFMPHGGAMHGPGGPRDDLIPVMASNGEFMLSKAAVDAAGDGSHAMGIARLEKFNDMGNRRYG